jgi:hypothetical protein
MGLARMPLVMRSKEAGAEAPFLTKWGQAERGVATGETRMTEVRGETADDPGVAWGYTHFTRAPETTDESPRSSPPIQGASGDLMPSLAPWAQPAEGHVTNQTFITKVRGETSDDPLA